MASVRFLYASCLVAVAWPAGQASAQTFTPRLVTLQMVQPINTEADALAAAVRRLGANPRDLGALMDAGDLSFKLGDATAAASFYKRAEQIDPANGRVKAGIGRILVNGEHPGEALRYFDLASRYRYDVANYAGDRGFAYDLIGEQERAQRDYRSALRVRDDDEVRRRYALSLGISGRREEALAEIDTLLRKSDRGAWRARAFILAMGGDVAGANRIATSMMPGGMATGLAPFFQRLATLPAIDRAFAVHFGEVRATPERLADARMVPVLAALGPDPYARPAPAAVQVAQVDPKQAKRDRDRAAKDARAAAKLAANEAKKARKAAATPGIAVAQALAPPLTRASAAAKPLVTGVPRASGIAPAAVPTRVASLEPTRRTAVSVGRTSLPTPAAADVAPVRSAPSVPTQTIATNLPQDIPAYPTTAPSPAPVTTRAAVATPPLATPVPGVVPATTVAATPVAAATLAAVPPPANAPTLSAPVTAVASTVPVPPRMSEDSILARIIAGISIPASELGVAPPVREVAVTPAATSGASLDQAARTAERNAAVDETRKERATRRAVERKLADAKVTATEDAPKLVAKGKRGKATDVADAEPMLARKGAKSAIAAKTGKDADVADTAALRKGAKTKSGKTIAKDDPAATTKGEPARIWVQVSGGANEGDLPKAWKAAQAKAPALAGRKAYATPLRATNRVVTGPFKTEAEARAMVNQLAKQGMSAFTFTSTRGQKMQKLDEK